MTELCLRCGLNPIADEGPPYFPFCEACWPHIRDYSVDENGDFIGFLTEAEIEERYRQAAEAAISMDVPEGERP